MLLFTNEQQRAINAARAGFNTRMTALAQACAGDMVGNAATVPIDAWRRIDTRATRIQRDVLAVFNRLAAANSTPVGIGDLVSYFPKVSDSGEVHVSMDGRSEGSADQAVVSYEGTPVPILDSYARMGWRQMEVIRKGQTALDVETIANHQRKVAEKVEDMVLNGLSSIVVGGSTIYGLRNHPQRNTGTHGLTLATATGAEWLTAVRQICTLLIGDNAFGKITLFLNYSNWFVASSNEFAAGYPKTILQRILEIEQIEAVVPASKVPANNLIGVAGLGSGDWGSILSAMPMVTRPKMRQNPEDDYVFGVMAAVAPQFRVDANGQTQIAHTTTS
jgi:uncharacterized linocin/CFP29 family protein